jgi:hypothetical protein
MLPYLINLFSGIACIEARWNQNPGKHSIVVEFWSTPEFHLFQPMYGFAGPKNIGLAENLGLDLQG